MRRWLAAAVGIVLFAGVALVQGAGPAAALNYFNPGIRGVCGPVWMRTFPPDLQENQSTSDAVQVFNEGPSTAALLTTAVPVDINAEGTYDRPSALPSPKPVIDQHTDG